MDTFSFEVGKRIKKMRESLDISQEKIAEILGIPRTSISQLENGKREIKSSELVQLAKTFNCSVDQLLDLEKEPTVIVEGIKDGDTAPGEIRISVPQKNLAKFKEVLLYVLSKVGSRPHIGETVLYKLLYFIDFDFYEKYEEQLMGASYIKNHFGPTPVEFKTIVKEMEKNKEITKVDNKYFKYPQTKFLPLREPKLALLKAHELGMIDDVLNRLGHMNASEISEYSHNDVPWLTAERKAVIPYESVFYRTSPYSVRPADDGI